ncbi:MAG: hypothetical protein HFI85_01305 [Clostridia bacterium]|jgi:hypothetical protein|nr:hypothetical protein [Clostridia bacterium]
MKKSLKVFMSVLCLCPLLLLAGCEKPASYKITAMPSDSILGYVQGAYNNEQKTEGSKITLVARENSPETNPFICWVKDYKKVASTSKSLPLTYNKSTAGSYTAVYAENSHTQMMFATLSKVSFETEQYTTINYEILTTGGTSGSENSSSFAAGSFSASEEYKTDLDSILYFGNVNTNYDFRLQVKLKLLNSQNAETTYDIPLMPSINRASFDDTGTAVINLDIPVLYSSITLTFEKLNSTMYAS